MFFSYLGQFVCFTVTVVRFGGFSLVCFELSVPVPVIVWKDLTLEWPIIICWAGCHSLSGFIVSSNLCLVSTLS